MQYLRNLVNYFKYQENAVNIDKATISVHCHNDLGLAVSNSLSAIISEQDRLNVLLMEFEKRQGTLHLEIVMCLKTEKIFFHFSVKLITKKFQVFPTSFDNYRFGTAQQRKVGKNAFAHESGIHQDGMLKHSNTYEIITPESVGLSSSELVLGKHSGRHAFKVKLPLKFNENKINELFVKFKNLADKKRQVFDEDY